MKKLKNKIFWTIFILLSLFLITILGIFNFQDYRRAKNEVEKNLFRMNFDKSKKYIQDDPDINSKTDIDNNLNFKSEKNNPNKYMDVVIYTILLDDNNQIIEIINHSENENSNIDIEKAVTKIISKNTSDCTYIGNLYFESFSYNYISNKFITIIDNTNTNKNVRLTLEISIFLFFLAEIIIIIISQLLSKWIINPVVESFNKQKEFIADASHELKTPLSIIMASAEAIEGNQKSEKWIKNIKSESERMSNLITRLLDLTKTEVDNEIQLYEEINFSKLVEKSILILESLTYEKNIKLNYNIEKNIILKCNSAEMKQLLSILLDNAIKHSSKKGKIIVNLSNNKNNILLEVINKGKAIPKEEETKIFERFYRLDKSRNRNSNSYGLGLAIAKNIVEKHNGYISASSNKGYTTFTVMLKRKEH